MRSHGYPYMCALGDWAYTEDLSGRPGRYKNSIVVIGLVTQLCPTLGGPVDCSPPGSSVPGILQARIPQWVAMPFSIASSPPRDWTQVSCIAGGFFTIWATAIKQRQQKKPGDKRQVGFCSLKWLTLSKPEGSHEWKAKTNWHVNTHPQQLWLAFKEVS